jgi:xanthine dehydrogenase YagS FAD-binding subunit
MSAQSKHGTGTVVAEWRAAGTDLSERRRSGVSAGAVADLAPTAAMRRIAWSKAGAARIGASVTVAEIASNRRLVGSYAGLAATAIGLATPQIRHLATLGGNLAQKTRCWYYRNPEISCLKKGGSACPARAGNHLYGVAFDLGPCVAPHPSSLAAALVAYEATVSTDRRKRLTMAETLGDGSHGASDNALQPGEVITVVEIPPPVEGERAVYKRAIGRMHAEWPLVEVVARVVVAEGWFELAKLAAGGIAPVPMRLDAAEKTLHGKPANPETIARAAAAAVTGASPLPMTAYKVDLLEGLVRDVLEQCLDQK